MLLLIPLLLVLAAIAGLLAFSGALPALAGLSHVAFAAALLGTMVAVAAVAIGRR